MSAMVDEPIKTFSVGFAEREANELEYARLVAEEIRHRPPRDHHSPEQFFRGAAQTVWHEDEPIGFIASVPLYFVSKLAQQHVKVVLTGEGSDETARRLRPLPKDPVNCRCRRSVRACCRHLSATRFAAASSRRCRRLSSRKLNRTFLSRDSDIEESLLRQLCRVPQRDAGAAVPPRTRAKIDDLRPIRAGRHARCAKRTPQDAARPTALRRPQDLSCTSC